MTTNVHWISFWGDRNVLELDGGNGYTTPNIIIKRLHLFAYLKRENSVGM